MSIKLESILAATDLTSGSNRAAERAAMLARTNGLDKIRVLHVVDEPWLAASGDLPAALGAAERELEALRSQLGREPGVNVDTLIVSGSPMSVIREKSRGSDLLVLGASDRHPLRDLVIGTTAQRLLAKTPASVLVARNVPRGQYRRVLVALDLSEFDDQAIAWARAVAPEAHLDLVHAFDTQFEGKLRYAGVGADVIDQYRFRSREAALRGVGSVASRVPGPSRPVAVPWPIAAGVVDQARSSRSDLIVVGRPGRSWLSNLLMHPVADLVLESAESDVLVVH
ncbi:MAG TPA: universal stress protein [Usitatibacter sp.]|nr:universal stress protein [Usitatibacter sp.]